MRSHNGDQNSHSDEGVFESRRLYRSFERWILVPGYGFLAAGLGSALADVFSGYVIYAPATFAIKGLMALVAFATFRLWSKRIGKLPSRLLGGVLAEIVMVMGYFVFEGFMYGFIPSAVNIPTNAVQGVAGLLLGIVLVKVFERFEISFK